jgi:hypothetical protein
MLRWQMAEQFGWSLEYIDSLTIADLHEYLQIEHGKGKAMEQPKKGKK